MKRLILLSIVGLFLAGCGAGAKQSGFWQHDTVYRNWEHLTFSWYGYSNPTEETLDQSQQQDWWGIEIPYIPAK